jgi:hypothetical protein
MVRQNIMATRGGRRGSCLLHDEREAEREREKENKDKILPRTCPQWVACFFQLGLTS